MKMFFKFIAIVLIGLLLSSTVLAKNCSEQSIIFQVNQDQMSFDNSTLKSAIMIPIDETTNQYGLQLKLKKNAALKLKAISSKNIGQKARLIWNDVVISSPRIQSELGGEFMLTGLTQERAKQFVECIAAR